MTATGVDSSVDRVHRLLWDSANITTIVGEDVSLEQRVRELISVVEPLAGADRIAHICDEVRARVDGLGPLHEHGQDPAVTEIMVNGDGSVWVERSGNLELTNHRLEPHESEHLVRRLAASAGRRIDHTRPSVDVRLVDGSRLHAILPPLAVDGPCITIRRFAAHPIRLDEMATADACAFLEAAVGESKTIVVAGGTSSGKTTLLNALANSIDPDERVVTIEDAAELRLPGRHIVRLETRTATEGTDAVGLRELTRHALRMRPDRIICGEMRGAEALDLVQAMNTGHRGSLSTVHANGSSDALRRIETMMLLGDADLPLRAIREQLASCIDLVVMTARAPDGSRGVVEIAAVPDEPAASWALDQVYVAP